MVRKQWVLVTVGLLWMVSAAGCLGSDDAPGTPRGDDVANGGEGNETADGNVTAVIRVSVEGNETVPDNGSLPIPLGANVTFDGTASVGANLTYAWDFGGNATGSNATEVYVYEAPGLYNVTLTVSQGNASASSSVMLNVSRAGPAPGSLAGTDRHQFAGSLTLGNPNSATTSGTDYRDHIVTINATAPDGTPAMAKKARIVLDGSGTTNVDMRLQWRSPSGTALANGPGSNTPDQTINYEGDMPPGNYVIRVRLFLGAQASYTVRAEIDYIAT